MGQIHYVSVFGINTQCQMTAKADLQGMAEHHVELHTESFVVLIGAFNLAQKRKDKFNWHWLYLRKGADTYGCYMTWCFLLGHVGFVNLQSKRESEWQRLKEPHESLKQKSTLKQNINSLQTMLWALTHAAVIDEGKPVTAGTRRERARCREAGETFPSLAQIYQS